jgi:NAD(P)-dependent dehydrogenase (short-subunit alcohol dehydrogenase family)
MDLKLDGKRALVTGASSGIGREIARALAREGATVVACGRNRERTEESVAMIADAGGKALAAVGDLTSDADADAIARTATDALGGIDILVNNAGGGSESGDSALKWHEFTPEKFHRSYDLNLVAAARMVNRLAPAMCERGWGRVINISSSVGKTAMASLHHYGAAKMALENYTLNLSMDLAKQGVTVNVVVPGLILTDVAQGFIHYLRDSRGWPDDPDEIQRRYTVEVFPQPVPRFGRPQEIASAVTFLASPLSDYTTGATLRVDGGMTRCL